MNEVKVVVDNPDEIKISIPRTAQVNIYGRFLRVFDYDPLDGMPKCLYEKKISYDIKFYCNEESVPVCIFAPVTVLPFFEIANEQRFGMNVTREIVDEIALKKLMEKENDFLNSLSKENILIVVYRSKETILANDSIFQNTRGSIAFSDIAVCFG